MYLVPIFNLHAGLMPLGFVWSTLFFEPSGLNVAVAFGSVVLQVCAAALIYWALRGFRWWKGLLILVSAPVFWIGANYGLFWILPGLVLIGGDTRPEAGDLELACSLPEVLMAQVNKGSDLAMERAGEVLLQLADLNSRGLLTMPGCRLEVLPIEWNSQTVDWTAPGGRLLGPMGPEGLRHWQPGMTAPEVIPHPNGATHSDGALSDDGRAIVWLGRDTPSPGRPGHHLRILDPATRTERVETLDLDPKAQPTIIGASSADGPFTLAIYPDEVLQVNAEGEVVWGPVSPPGIERVRWGFQKLAAGWVAWDGYREEGAARLVWDLGRGIEERVMPRGRRIHDLDITPDGRFIAVSLTLSLRFGSARESFFIIDTRSGEEIYRRYSDVFSRTRLAFIGNDYIAITYLGEAATSGIDVFRLPN